ncbi:MAG: ATP-binding cassette domain-containing protein [Deltaproteobacteria bacterium]|nr:ATP-binding cassette domain-containing protein [Deltaproteobacteria bacterium]
MSEEPMVARRLDIDELSSAPGREHDPKVVRWLLSYLGRHRMLTATVYGLVVVSALTGFAVLPFTKLLMDSVQSLMSDQASFDRQLGATTLGRLFVGASPLMVISLGALLLIGAKLVSSLIGALSQTLNDVLCGRIAADMRKDLFRHVIELPEDYAAEHPVGELTARFVQNLNASVGIYTTVFFMPVISLCTLLFASVYVVMLDPLLGVLSLLFGPVYYLSTGPLSKAIEKKVQGVSTQFAAVNQDLQETLSATREIKANASEARERAEFTGNVTRMYEATLSFQRWQLIASQTGKFISEAAPVLILAVGAFMIARGGSQTLGDLMVFFSFVPTLLGSMNSVSQVRLSYVNAVTFAREIWQVLQERREADAFAGKKDLVIPERLDPKVPIIELDHVYMTYPRSGYRVSDMTVKIYPGQTVAIIGAGGSGKSTIFNMLFKLYDYQRGSVKVFGQELRDLTIDSVRRAFGLMNQFPFFFQRSFVENVLYGIDERDEATLQRMKTLCAELELDKVVDAMPERYETVITNRGSNLSGSQQKRTALVRALMREPKVLLLDEPLSGLSPDQRREVAGRIKKLAGDRTILVITHDLELIEDMDLVLVFKREDLPADEMPIAAMPIAGMPIAAMPIAGKAIAATGVAMGKTDGTKGDGKGAMPAKGEAMPAKGEAMPAKGEAMPAKGEAMPAKGDAKGPKGAVPTKGAKAAGGAAPSERPQHGIIAEQGSYAELSRTGRLFRTLIGKEAESAPPA